MSIDKEKLKALANEAVKEWQDWFEAGKQWPMPNRALCRMQGEATAQVVLNLIYEAERSKEDASTAASLLDKRIREYRILAKEVDNLRSEIVSLQDSYSQISENYNKASFACDELRKDAERYRWLRSDKVDLEQFNIAAHEAFDGLIDEAMSKERP